jgi:glycosyltransferase involved in cell wall biosynthesis
MRRLTSADVSIVIPTRERWPRLQHTLRALTGQTVSGFEVVVSVDGDDQVPPPLDGARTVVNPRGGAGAARNAGARAASRDILLLLDDDMIASPGLIERHLDMHQAHPQRETAILGHVDWHPSVNTNRINRWLDWSGTQFDYANIRDHAGLDVGFGRFFSCNVSLHRDLFLEVGGFDEDFIVYYEDIECGWRLDQRGMRLLYQPRAGVHHLQSYDLAGIERRFERVAVGERLMCTKHPWFEPFFHRRMCDAAAARRVFSLWPRIVEHVSPRAAPARRLVRSLANRWYYAHLAPTFLDAWERSIDVVDLREYLGTSYRPHALAACVGAMDSGTTEHATLVANDEETTLYQLVANGAFARTDGCVRMLRTILPPGARILDHHAGTGTSGIRLLESGYAVDFTTDSEQSARFLDWRLKRRRLFASVRPASGRPRGRYDAALCVEGEVCPRPQLIAELEESSSCIALRWMGAGSGDGWPAAAKDRAQTRSVITAHAADPPAWNLLVYRNAPMTAGQRVRATLERTAGAE